jgi:hypothetical protein
MPRTLCRAVEAPGRGVHAEIHIINKVTFIENKLPNTKRHQKIEPNKVSKKGSCTDVFGKQSSLLEVAHAC